MTDTQPAGTTLTDPPKDSSAQMRVALAIVGGLVLLGVGLLLVAHFDAGQMGIGTACLAGVGTIVGIFGNALAAPSGISAVIAAARKPPSSS